MVFKGEACIYQAKTNKEFNLALKQAEIIQKDKLCYIEIFADKMDLPKLAKNMFSSKALKKEEQK